MVWDSCIPKDQRYVNLVYDSSRMITTLNCIKKKDTARITISQLRDADNPQDWNGPRSSSEFNIYISCGDGGDGREGIKSVHACRSDKSQFMISSPNPSEAFLLIIPIKSFRRMIESFAKCKKQTIRFHFYANTQIINGLNYKAAPGLLITTVASDSIVEKFGTIPDEESESNLDIIRPPTDATPNIVVIDDQDSVTDPNEFTFSSDKIPIFNKLSSMHNEGNVRIYYSPKCHLRIVHRFGAFGECQIFLHNKHVSYS